MRHMVFGLRFALVAPKNSRENSQWARGKKKSLAVGYANGLWLERWPTSVCQSSRRNNQELGANLMGVGAATGIHKWVACLFAYLPIRL